MDTENTTEMPREGESLTEVGERLAGQEASQGNDTTADSSTVPNENGEAPSQGGAPVEAATPTPNTSAENNVPFNEHPRWKEMQQELAYARQRADELAGYVQQIPGYLDSMRQQLTSKEAPIPEWFVELYGNSPKAWQLYQQRETQMYQQMQQNIVQGIQQQAQYQEQVTTYWESQVENEYKRLEQSGKKFDRAELQAVLLNYRPIGENGLLDFEKAYDILIAQKQAAVAAGQAQKRQKIAEATAPTSGGDAPVKDFVTTAEIRGKNWNSL